MSIKPGATTRPRASIISASGGGVSDRTETTRSPRMTTIERGCGADPDPSISIAPTIAMVRSAAAALMVLSAVAALSLVGAAVGAACFFVFLPLRGPVSRAMAAAYPGTGEPGSRFAQAAVTAKLTCSFAF